jgi:transcriptional regulator of acetoin/glycerol metabolism
VSAKRWFRVLCATNSDLKKMVDAGRFRADLYFRLDVFPLRAPPLREHLSDVPLLAERIATGLTPPAALTPESLGPLMTYDWPGNVRELHNVIEFAAMRAASGPVLPEHFPAPFREAATRLDAHERTKPLELLAAHGGNRTVAARALGVSRVTLWKRLRRHGLVDRSDQ